MPSGIEITCHRRFGQFLIMEQPILVAEGKLVAQLRWGAPMFLPLHPGQHRFVVQFRYMGKACGAATFWVELREGEVQRFVYKAPFIVYSAGTITRTR